MVVAKNEGVELPGELLWIEIRFEVTFLDGHASGLGEHAEPVLL